MKKLTLSILAVTALGLFSAQIYGVKRRGNFRRTTHTGFAGGFMYRRPQPGVRRIGQGQTPKSRRRLTFSEKKKK